MKVNRTKTVKSTLEFNDEECSLLAIMSHIFLNALRREPVDRYFDSSNASGSCPYRETSVHQTKKLAEKILRELNKEV